MLPNGWLCLIDLGLQWLIVSDSLRLRVRVRVSYVRIVHINPQPLCRRSGKISRLHFLELQLF